MFARNAARHCFGPPHGFARLVAPDKSVGAVVGGFAVGIAENLLGAYVVGEEVKLSVALVIIIGVLVAKPSGLFGRRIVARV